MLEAGRPHIVIIIGKCEVLVMRGKGQQVLFFSSVFTEELSGNAEIAECSLVCMWDETRSSGAHRNSQLCLLFSANKEAERKTKQVSYLLHLGSKISNIMRLFDSQKQLM